jgi:hypothetical protein
VTSAVKYVKRIGLPFGISARTITFIECYFERAPVTEKADVIACLFQSGSHPDWRSYEGATRLIDLTPDLDSLFAAFTKGTRYEVKRASERDGIQTTLSRNPPDTRLDEFMDYYDSFAASKGVPGIQREHVRALATAGKIAVSDARGADGSVLAAHAYLVTPLRIRLTHSASLFRTEHSSAARAQIGRANRLLHWNDLTAFKTMGATWYDFGGWYEGSRNQAVLKINAFKQEFGGQVVKEWNLFRSGSAGGAVYLALRDIMLRTRR